MNLAALLAQGAAARRALQGTLLYTGTDSNMSLRLPSMDDLMLIANRDRSYGWCLEVNQRGWNLGQNLSQNDNNAIPQYAFSPGALFPTGATAFNTAAEDNYVYSAQGGTGRMQVITREAGTSLTGNHSFGDGTSPFTTAAAYILLTWGATPGAGYQPRVGIPGEGEHYFALQSPFFLASIYDINRVTFSTGGVYDISVQWSAKKTSLVLLGPDLVHSAASPTSGVKVTTPWKPELVMTLSKGTDGYWMTHSRARDTADNATDLSKAVNLSTTARSDDNITWHDDGYTLTWTGDTRYGSDFNVLAFRGAD